MFKADSAAAGDDDSPVVEGVVELLESAVRTGSGDVELGWAAHLEGLMRPLVVVMLDESVKASLLSEEVLGGGLRGFLL